MAFEKTVKLLDEVNVDLNQLYWVIRQTHWYMRDNGFLFYHPLMDEWMDDVDEQIDEVAERIITLGGDPTATLAEMAEKTKIKDSQMDWNASLHDQLAHLLEGYRHVNELFKQIMDAAAEENDEGTQDFIATFIADTEKRIWMITAELKKAPELDK